jgi:hypothetical protein
MLRKFFASMLQGASVNLSNAKNAQRWIKVGSAYYFVIHTFSASDSASISSGMQNPSTFMFTDLGNISCNNGAFTFKNPLDRNSNTDFGVTSIADAAASSNQYVYDSSHVITPNLLYILYKQQSTWYLLYNPIHSSEFKKYYNYVVNVPNVILEWGVTPVETDSYLNLQQVFQAHCDAMQTTNANGTTTFLDPACNMIYSSQQCRNSSFFADNVTQYPAAQVDRYMSPLNAMGANDPPNCVCIGAPHDYISANVQRPMSFIYDFLQMGTCNSDLQMNVCNIITEGGNIDVRGSQYDMQCGSNSQLAPSKSMANTNLQDDGSAARYTASIAAQNAEAALVKQTVDAVYATIEAKQKKAALPATPTAPPPTPSPPPAARTLPATPPATSTLPATPPATSTLPSSSPVSPSDPSNNATTTTASNEPQKLLVIVVAGAVAVALCTAAAIAFTRSSKKKDSATP